jgi:hypothetical protein
MDTGTMKDYIEDLIQKSNEAAQVMQEAAHEIKALRELLRKFYLTSQCIECWAEDAEIVTDDWLDNTHNSELCEVAQVQREYRSMFQDNDYMMAEDDD